MAWNLLSLVFLFLAIRSSSSNKYSREANQPITDDPGPCLDDGKPKLYRWDPIEVFMIFFT